MERYRTKIYVLNLGIDDTDNNIYICHIQDICDRKIAVLRSLIREYQMTRQNVTNEEEMMSALTFNGG